MPIFILTGYLKVMYYVRNKMKDETLKLFVAISAKEQVPQVGMYNKLTLYSWSDILFPIDHACYSADLADMSEWVWL